MPLAPTGKGAHAFLAPSSAHRWVICPGSALMQSKYPEEGDKAAAAEGTAAHHVMQCLLTNAPVSIGDVAPNGVTITQAMFEAGQVIADDVLTTIQPDWRQFISVEQPIDIPRVHTRNWGTPDVKAIMHNAHMPGAIIYVWDFKYGYDIVEVFENWQLIDYAAGCLTELNNQRATMNVPAISEDLVQIVLRVIQPRAFHPDGIIREWRTTGAGLRGHIHRLNLAAEEACGENPTCVPNPVACEHCSARHACEALLRAAYRGMDIARKALPVDLPPAAVGLELRMVVEAIGLLEARKSGLEQQAESMIRNAIQVPHWTMVPGVSREKWSMPDAEVILAGKTLGVDLARPPEAITPVQARAAGMDPTIVAVYSTRPSGAMKLIIDDGSYARRVFGA